MASTGEISPDSVAAPHVRMWSPPSGPLPYEYEFKSIQLNSANAVESSGSHRSLFESGQLSITYGPVYCEPQILMTNCTSMRWTWTKWLTAKQGTWHLINAAINKAKGHAIWHLWIPCPGRDTVILCCSLHKFLFYMQLTVSALGFGPLQRRPQPLISLMACLCAGLKINYISARPVRANLSRREPKEPVRLAEWIKCYSDEILGAIRCNGCRQFSGCEEKWETIISCHFACGLPGSHLGLDRSPWPE